ncbi:hypothetical protein ACFSC6_00600 [Rufibacter sediminis]
MISRPSERNGGMRDIEALLGVSREYVLDNLCRQAERHLQPPLLVFSPARAAGKSIQLLYERGYKEAVMWFKWHLINALKP